MNKDFEYWKKKCKPFTSSAQIECNIILTPDEFKTLSMRHAPEEMEDRWFMYCDDDVINYYRSWTGIKIFAGHFRRENDAYVIYSLDVNNNKDEYGNPDIEDSLRTFKDLINRDSKKA